MKLTRRDTIMMAMGTAVAAVLPFRVSADTEASIAAFTGGAELGSVTFGALAGAQFASTRIRLAGTQDVVAVAKMADGSFVKASSEVKVTIGGCGG